MSDRCDICGKAVPVGGGYVVRIDVFADPETGPLVADEAGGGGGESALAAVVEQMKHLSADELQDAVHRRFEFRLCPACQRAYLSNPLGMPRKVQLGRN